MIVFVLAKETGWSERFIRRELPISRALQYLHCISYQSPYVWTVEPSKTFDSESFELLKTQLALVEDEEIDIDA